MAQSLIQPSFAGGELAPAMSARVDVAKYHVGARTLRNFFVHASGGASNRPGTKFVGRVKDSSHPVRLIPFQFSTVQTYVLEFGHQYMRVVMNGGHVLEPDFAITAATAANPCTLTAPGHNFANGDEVFITGAIGMTALNGNRYLVAAVTTTGFQLHNLDGVAVNAGGFPAYGGSGTVARVYTLVTPYAGSDLALLKYTQSADIMTLCHTGYVPMDLSRTQHWVWTLSTITFQPQVVAPTATAASPAGGGSQYFSYVVTAIATGSGEESLPSIAANCQNSALNQDSGVINTVSWSAVTNAASYRVYKAPIGTTGPIPAGSLYGYIGATTGISFDDANIESDGSQTPPQGQDPFAGGNNPGCVTYYEQRKVFAGSGQYPESVWMTQPGNFWNMDTSSPTQDDDAITLTVASQQVNAVKSLISVNALLVLTSSGAFKISPGSTTGALTPATVQVQPQSYNGCSDVPPLVIEYDILYVQSKGSSVRDLSYNFYVDLYTGTDMTVMSSHLFFSYQILEWAYAEEPFKLVWAVRNDGTLLSLTYMKNQDVQAWTRHDTLGQFLSVASISEGNEDAVYFVVSRTIPGINGGQPVQYVERLASRNFLINGVADITSAWFVDCGLHYVGPPVTTVTGLSHLEGMSVAIVADGNVQPSQVVTNGAVTIQHAAQAITIGLPYSADLQTLDIDLGDPTIQGKRKKISAVTIRMENTRGLKAGPDQNSLVAIKERSTQGYGQPIPLTTGDERVLLTPSWNTFGSLWVRQDNPLPCTVLALIPELMVGDAAN